MTAQELLERLQLVDETERIEAKAGSDIGKSVLEAVCAFTNEPGMGGGWLLLGATGDVIAARLADPRRQALLNELPGALAARVGAVGQRQQPQDVQDLVVALCKVRAWRAEEIAALLSRYAENVCQNYLRPLLRAGRITMTRPDRPNDLDQAYRAAATA